MEVTESEHCVAMMQYYLWLLSSLCSGVRNIFDQLQYNIQAPVNDDDCEEEDEEDEDYASKKKDDFDSDDPVERRCFSLL